eukprot:4620452-Amphidinium_carterae.1
MQKISGSQSWTTLTPANVQQDVIAMVSLQRGWQEQKWASLSLNWIHGLAPPGQVLLHKPRDEAFMVLKTFENGVLVWPVNRSGERNVVLACCSGTRPIILTSLSLEPDVWYILPSSW